MNTSFLGLKRIILISQLLFSHLLVIAAGEPVFHRLNTDDGLSMSVVNAITQDRTGFMWFGTEDGLNRYDGRKFQIYRNNVNDKYTLSDNWILSLFEDSKGKLWVGTNGGGLNLYDRNHDNFKAYRNSPGCSNCISGNKVKAITEGRDGILYIGTDKGLSLFNPVTGKFETLQVNKGGSQVEAIIPASATEFWVGTFEHGLFKYNTDNRNFTPHHDLDNAGGFKVTYSNRIKSLLDDGNGGLWIATHGAGLIHYTPSSDSFRYYLPGSENGAISNKSVFALLKAEKGNIWAGTYGGINVFNRELGQFTVIKHSVQDPGSLSSNFVRALYRDQAGSVWVGTNGGGLSVFHKSANQFGYHKADPTDPTKIGFPPMAFTEDPFGNLWVGTFGGGLSKVSPNGSITHFPKEVNNTHENILSLYTGPDSILWIGSWGNGLNHYDLKKQQFGKSFLAGPAPSGIIDNNVTSITGDGRGGLWIGTLKGLCHFNPVTRQFRHYTTSDGLSSNLIFSILPDGGNLWVGTSGGGLNLLEISTGKVTRFLAEETGLSNNSIGCIYDDGKGNLWLGTRLGLNRFDKKSREFTAWYQADGLPNDYIHGILPGEDGVLWLSTVRGLCRFNTDSTAGPRFRNYYLVDGLQDNEFNQGAYYKSKNGTLYFGGISGYNAFQHNDIRNNEHIPPIAFINFRKFGKNFTLDTSILSKKTLELSYRDNFFEFEFAGLDFVMPEKNLYSYKMDGFDEEWTPAGSRSYASYTNLGGGEYTFRVRASNNDGVWNDEGIAIRIFIQPPFYKTTWFYLLSILCGIAGVGLFTRYRTAKISKEKRILEARVQERTIELAQKNKDITSSIQYAQRIQEAILPQRELIYTNFGDCFIYYQPKDIVSGDFYWFSVRNGKKIIASVDCTGHGVPGAFMSMIGHNLLNQIVNEKGITSPARILEELNRGVQQALKQDNLSQATRDGMDVCVCAFDLNGKSLEYAGALRPLYFIRKGELVIYNGARFPIGGLQTAGERKYSQEEIHLQPGDQIYLFSDGYADQFGGPKGKKYKVRKFQELLLATADETMAEQGKKLEAELKGWRGDQEQVDDVLVIGIRV